MDLVDEEHVALFEIGEECCEIAGLGDDRARGGAKADAELPGHDLRQRGLAEAGGTDEQHVIQRLAALARRLDEDREVLARLLLADEVGQRLRAQRGVADIVAAALGRDHAGGRAHFASSFKPEPDQLRGLGLLAGAARGRRRSRPPPAAGRSRD